MSNARSILVFSAHAADFVWRAGGAIALYASRGYRVRISALGFPVWSTAISAQGTSKTIAGSVNIPIVCAGAAVNPGDVIVGDADGVVVVARESAPTVADAADQRLAKEQRTRDRLKAGELGLDIYGLRDVLAQRGVVWRD